MTILLANAGTPSANTVWLVVLAISALGGNLATIGLWMATRRQQSTLVSPQPLLIAMEKEFATKKEFEDQKKHCTDRHGQLFAKIEKIDKGVGEAIERQIEVVRRDVVAVGREVSSLQTSTDLQNQSLAHLNTKLDRIIENKLT